MILNPFEPHRVISGENAILPYLPYRAIQGKGGYGSQERLSIGLLPYLPYLLYINIRYI